LTGVPKYRQTGRACRRIGNKLAHSRINLA
jgi:hypothetical protein